MVGGIPRSAPRSEVRDHESRPLEQRPRRKLIRAGDGKAEKHYIPCHVGHEDVTQLKETDGVNQPGDDGEYEQHRRKRAMPLVSQELRGSRAWVKRHFTLQSATSLLLSANRK